MVLAVYHAYSRPHEAAFSQRLAAPAAPQAVDAAHSVRSHEAHQATLVVQASILLAADQQQQGEAQLPHWAAQTCPGSELPGLPHTPPAFTSQLSPIETSAGGAVQLDMGRHQPSPTQTAASTEQPRPSCSMPGSMQQPGSMQLWAPARELLPLWRHCLDHWAVGPSLSHGCQRSSPRLALHLALATAASAPRPALHCISHWPQLPALLAPPCTASRTGHSCQRSSPRLALHLALASAGQLPRSRIQRPQTRNWTWLASPLLC
ncbi:hypothetical protein V8C86DRAFT_2673311 [Haematococcus lacustris]